MDEASYSECLGHLPTTFWPILRDWVEPGEPAEPEFPGECPPRPPEPPAPVNAGVTSELCMKLTGHLSEAAHRGYTHHELQTLKNAVSKLPSLNA